MKKFLNRIDPIEYEGLMSYLYRLARKNYIESLNPLFQRSSSIINSYNCNYLKESNWESKAKFLVNMSNNCIDDLVLNKFNKILFQNDQPKVFDYLKIYNHKYVRYCPECLEEHFYYRIYWDISFLTICTKHKRFLIDECPKCMGRIKMSHLLKGKCLCGMDLLDSKPIENQPKDVIQNSQSLISDLLLGNIKEIVISYKDSKIVLNQEEYFQLFFLFANLIDRLPTNHVVFNEMKTKPPEIVFGLHNKTTDDRNLNMLTTIATVSHALVCNSQKFLPLLINHLDCLKEQKLLYRKSYERKMKILKDIFETTKGNIYHLIYSDYIHSLGPEPENKRMIAKPLKDKVEFIPFHAACMMLNTKDYFTVKNLCKYGLINSIEKEENILIEKKSVIRYQNMRKMSINMKQVTEILGLNLYVITELTNEGLLKAVHGPQVDGYPKWIFKEKHIVDFHNEIMNKCEFLEDEQEWIPFKKVNYKIRLFDLSVPDIFISALNGDLKIGLKNVDDKLEELFILKSDFYKLLVESNRQRVNRIGFTCNEIPKVLKIGTSTLKKYIQEGIFKLSSNDLNPNQNLSKSIDKKQIISYLMENRGLSLEEAETHVNNSIELLVDRR